MPTRITNLSKQLLVVPLNSGETLHLAPGETSAAPVEDYELARNEKVEKLRSYNLLALDAEASEPPPVEGISSTPEMEAAREIARRRPAR